MCVLLDAYERAEIIREKGTNRSQFYRGEVDKYTWVDIGSSFLPSEINAAFLFAQMEMAEVIQAKRQLIWRRYYQGLKPLADKGLLSLPYVSDYSMQQAHMFYIITNDLQTRTSLIDYLKNKGIHSVFHYVPLHLSEAGKKYGRIGSSMKYTENLSDRLLRLPFYYELTEDEIHMITNCIIEALS